MLSDQHGCVIICGSSNPRPNPGTPLANCAVVVCPERPLQYVSKRFLWHFDNHWFTAGSSLEPVDTPLGKLGILICADGRIPTIAAGLVARGARLLVVVTAWVSSGRDPHQLENIQADLLARVRAWENAVPLVAANKIGAEYESVLYCGKSQAINADGEIVAIASQDHPETLSATITTTAERPVVQLPLALPPNHRQAKPQRLALTRCLTADQYNVASWSDVAAIICRDHAANLQFTTQVPQIVRLDPSSPSQVVDINGQALVVLSDDRIKDPAYLCAARLAGYDIFLWYPQALERAWILPLARTRALELRAYLLIFDSQGDIQIIDPHGSVIAGSTPTLRMPQFLYDPALTAATTLVPGTNILDGLRCVNTQK